MLCYRLICIPASIAVSASRIFRLTSSADMPCATILNSTILICDLIVCCWHGLLHGLWPCIPACVAAHAPPSRKFPGIFVPLVLTGGTVVDVTDWGRSAKDLQNAVVIIQ